jgi:predicted transcriptional regulator
MERGVQLTPSQKKIVELLRQEGDLAMEEIQRRLTMKPEELKREFAALRHMGLVRAKKMGEKICLSII